MNIEEYFKPSENDQRTIIHDNLNISLIFRMDSYKFSHPYAFPEGIKGMTSYGEARISDKEVVVPFGWTIFSQKYLTQSITIQDVEAAEQFALAHFGRPLFKRHAWEKVVNVYNGKLPLIIRALPEGTIATGKIPLYTVTVLDEDLFWMSAAFETLIQRGFWYPTTIATNGYNMKQLIKRYFLSTGSDLNAIDYFMNDFGARGVSSPEQAEIGGAAHLINFRGSDNIEGVLTANHYYNESMSGNSVYATEHSVQCSFGAGEENAKNYLRKQLSNAVPGSIISIVLDGYDVYREANLLCTEFKQQIIDSGAKVVFRPDSGDMLEVVPKILKIQEDAFGFEKTSTGHKRIKYVGLIQGDGIDSFMLGTLLDHITRLGYSADCVVVGSGGGLLQKVNRDTLKFAQKASAILMNGEWVGIAKDPITDQGKKSKEGVLTTVRNSITGKLASYRLDQNDLTKDLVDEMKLVYYNGTLFGNATLAEIRNKIS